MRIFAGGSRILGGQRAGDSSTGATVAAVVPYQDRLRRDARRGTSGNHPPPVEEQKVAPREQHRAAERSRGHSHNNRPSTSSFI